jgi:peroxiredoxin
MPEPLYRRTQNVREAEFHDEMVGLDEVSGLAFGLNKTATAVWKQLEQSQSVAELKTTMLEWFSDVDEGTCEADVREVLSQLQKLGLVELLS